MSHPDQPRPEITARDGVQAEARASGASDRAAPTRPSLKPCGEDRLNTRTHHVVKQSSLFEQAMIANTRTD